MVEKEINLHIPQSLGARIECEQIMAIKRHIVSRQSNSPIMGCVQNTLISMYLLTNIFPGKKKEESITLAKFFDILTFLDLNVDINVLAERFYPFYKDCVSYSDGQYKFKDKIRGKILVSCILPTDLTLERRTDVNPEYPVVKIKNGVILPDSGPIEKKMVGRTSNSIVHLLWKYYSPTVCQDFITKCQCMNYIFLQTRGFSMGISDCVPTKLDIIESSLKEAIDKCEIIANSNKTEDEREAEINSILNKAMEIAPKLAKTSMNKGEENSLVIMNKCGAKGSYMNNGQISGFVGQQNMDGRRIPRLLNNGTRALPCFEEGDITPEARGFVKNSFLKGLTYWEAWFHAITGRRGIIDTGMKTGETGYAEKKMVQFLVDLKIHQDYSVRGVNGEIVQFIYGGDAMSANKIHFVPGLDYPFFVNPKLIADTLNFKTSTTKNKPRKLMKEEKLNFIKTLNFASVKTLCVDRLNKNMRFILFHLLGNVKICEDKIEQFFDRIRDILDDSKCDPGDMVGLIAACSIGEVTTQLTLNQHRSVGVSDKDITLGVPRLKELLSATKKPSSRSCFIYLKDGYFVQEDEKIKHTEELMNKYKKDSEKIEQYKKELDNIDSELLIKVSNLGSNLEDIHLGDIVENFEMKYIKVDDEIPKQSPIGIMTYEEYSQEFWVELHNDLFGAPDIQPQSWVVIINFNSELLFKYKLSVKKIAEIIENMCEDNKGTPLYCVPSPDNIAKMEIYFDFDLLEEHAETFLTKTKTKISEDEANLHNIGNFRYFVVRDVVIDFLKNIQISGIANIEKVNPKYDHGTKKWMAQTKGSNLLNILNDPLVDHTKTTSDDMWEIFNVLGVEAARSFIIEAIRSILSFDGTYIDVRHIRLLADGMTRKGTISSVNRDGIGRENGVLMKGMFEKVVDNFREAAAFGEVDPVNSLSAAVFMGTIPKCGTGLVEVKDKSTLPIRRN